MPNATKALKRRFARRHPTDAQGLRNGDSARDELSSSAGSSAMGQLIDMAEWRLLPPVDPTAEGAA